MRPTHAQHDRAREIKNRTYGGKQIIESNSITERYKNLFIHIPKTGGIAVKNCMIEHSMFSDHYFAADVRKEIKDKDVFMYTFLRNPYARIISIYEAVYRATAGEVLFADIPENDQGLHAIPEGYQAHPDKNFHYERKTRPVGVSFGAGWGDTLDYQPINQYFRGIVHGTRMQAAAVLESVGDTRTANLINDVVRESLSFEKFIDIIINEVWHVWWEPQTSFIMDDDDKVIVDYVGNTASLHQDLFEVTQLIEKRCNEKITTQPIQQVNTTKKSRPNLSDYYIDANTQKKVEKYYEKDLDYMKVKKLK